MHVVVACGVCSSGDLPLPRPTVLVWLTGTKRMFSTVKPGARDFLCDHVRNVQGRCACIDISGPAFRLGTCTGAIFHLM